MVEDLQAGWDAAVDGCLNGHDTCSYGGPTPGTGYWLRSEGCTGKHGDVCAWCDAEATTGFAGWADDGHSIFGVAACQPHADAWAAQHPEWQRGSEPEPLDGSEPELLDGAVLRPAGGGWVYGDDLLYSSGTRAPGRWRVSGVMSWVYRHGFRYYCHRCAALTWWWQDCPHKPRWYRG